MSFVMPIVAIYRGICRAVSDWTGVKSVCGCLSSLMRNYPHLARKNKLYSFYRNRYLEIDGDVMAVLSVGMVYFAVQEIMLCRGTHRSCLAVVGQAI